LQSAPSLDALDGMKLRTGSLRLANAGRVDALPGFDAGDWWVQDAAAALPARMLGDVNRQTVLDLCAAPGGKTAQLCAAGGVVTALDSSKARMPRVAANLARLGLEATLVVADALSWDDPTLFDAVLLDAPCSATGTIRRHPDIPLLKRETDIQELAAQQQAMMRVAARRVAPGGRMVFCTCSLEPEEGIAQIAPFLSAEPDFSIEPASAEALGVPENWITADGFLRTLPSFAVPVHGRTQTSFGLDGFFAACLRRRPN